MAHELNKSCNIPHTKKEEECQFWFHGDFKL